MVKHVLISLVCLVSVGNVTAQLAEYPDFKICLSMHLKAIERKMIRAIDATVSDSVVLIFPDGEVMKSKQKFMDFHKEWFADSTWRMTFNILKTVEKDDLGYAFVKYRSTRTNKDGSPESNSESYLLLIFEKQKDVWKLIHDQNTSVAVSN